MSNKENLIFALETAENDRREVEMAYASGNGVAINLYVVPEVMILGGEIHITDAERGNNCQITIISDEDVEYDDNGDETVYTVRDGAGTFRFYF